MIRFPTENEKRLYREAAGRAAPACVLIRFPMFGSFRGFTLGPVIFIATDRVDVIVHEMVHVRQFYDGWGIGFWAAYLWYRLTRGYRGNPYEQEAYAVQDRAKEIM